MRYYEGLSKRVNMIRRVHAERYMLLSLISFSASISVTRLFLSAAGYPQIGNGTFHIAHVLWGGLLLFISVLLVILFANRRVYTLGAVLGGAGMGLFIDEVGKFITQNNDYFFPAAAPIIYIFFLVIVLLFILIRRPPRLTPNANLVRALELMQDMVQRPLTNRERKALQGQLSKVMDSAQSNMQTDLARTILDMVDDDERPSPNSLHAKWHLFLDKIDDWYTPHRYAPFLIVGMLMVGLLSLKNPFNLLLHGQTNSVIQRILDFHIGNEVVPVATGTFFLVRVFFEVLVAVLLLSASFLMIIGKRNLGVTLGFAGLLLALTVVNIFLYYFEQFSTTLVVLFEFLLILGLAYYRETGSE